jgi:hypothetical protein
MKLYNNLQTTRYNSLQFSTTGSKNQPLTEMLFSASMVNNLRTTRYNTNPCSFQLQIVKSTCSRRIISSEYEAPGSVLRDSAGKSHSDSPKNGLPIPILSSMLSTLLGCARPSNSLPLEVSWLVLEAHRKILALSGLSDAQCLMVPSAVIFSAEYSAFSPLVNSKYKLKSYPII